MCYGIVHGNIKRKIRGIDLVPDIKEAVSKAVILAST